MLSRSNEHVEAIPDNLTWRHDQTGIQSDHIERPSFFQQDENTIA